MKSSGVWTFCFKIWFALFFSDFSLPIITKISSLLPFYAFFISLNFLDASGNIVGEIKTFSPGEVKTANGTVTKYRATIEKFNSDNGIKSAILVIVNKSFGEQRTNITYTYKAYIEEKYGSQIAASADIYLIPPNGV